MNLWEQLERGAGADGAPGQVAYHGRRLLLALLVAALTYALFPAAPAADLPVLEVGAVASSDVIAPFAFAVPKPAAELERERAAAAAAVVPVLVYQRAAADSARAALDGFATALDAAAAPARTDAERAAAAQRAAAPFGVRLLPDEAAYLAPPVRRRQALESVSRVLGEAAERGATSGGSAEALDGGAVVRRDGIERPVRSDGVLTFPLLADRARAGDPGARDPALRGAVPPELHARIVGAFFRPSLVPDRALVERRRAAAIAAVPAERYRVRAGEKVIGAHEVVGRDEFEKVRALGAELEGRRGDERVVGRVVGAVLFNALVVALFGITVWLFRPALYASTRALLTMAAAFALVVAAAALIARGEPSRPELIPVALAATVLGVLFDARIALVAAMVLAVLVGGQAEYRGTNALFLNLIGGVAAAFCARAIRRRTDVLYPVLGVTAAYLLGALAIGLGLGQPASEIARAAGWGALNAVVSVALAMVLLPAAEEYTGLDSYPRMLEWSDLNRPLMRRLALEAPGTFHHTINIANLAEAACTAIEADGLLARVGAYYHDIGKLKKPQYFVENQPRGRNPHDKLKPATSAQIIRDHVRAGLELAEEYGVPKSVRPFITEHHGTGTITYFYERARERDAATPVNGADYAYPGPAPRSAETAIVMLADGVEASARVLNDPTPEKIRDLVEHIVRQRMEQGQLRDAPLTLGQLEIVKEQFVRLLVGQYHTRIDYPAAGGGITAEFASA